MFYFYVVATDNYPEFVFRMIFGAFLTPLYLLIALLGGEIRI